MHKEEREIGGLNGYYVPPLTEDAPTNIIILLHGWGADGADLIDLALPLSQILPQTGFFAPNAPHPCSANPFGREWFDLTDRSVMDENALAARHSIHTALEGISSEFQISAQNVLLGGFSQGGMMSLLAGLSYHAPLAGIVSMAGALLAEADIPDADENAPPVLMIHGDADQVVPFQAMDLALQSLQAKGYETDRLACAGVAHGISQEAITKLGQFARSVFDHH